MPAPFRLYNTRTRKVEGFQPLVPGHVGLYVCGMTVYDEAHIGHARAMVVFDTFVRYLRHREWTVRFVRNFTDVDDKIIRRANERGENVEVLAQRYVDNFHRDMRELGLVTPDVEPRVTSSIPKILALIGTLVERGNAYPVDGNVWFDVPSCPTYGALSGQQVTELRSEDPDSGKRHPADFALWKAAKPGEPAWDSPWGSGRPGWHVECSAMAWDTLGTTIDIHGGGLDLVFPHHENEAAQSECAHGVPYARYWMHNGLLVLGGERVVGDGTSTLGALVDRSNRSAARCTPIEVEPQLLAAGGVTLDTVLPAGQTFQIRPPGAKMGKSLGNVVDIHDALREYPAEALRLYYLQNHYRSPLPYDADALCDALGMLGRLYEAREVAEKLVAAPGSFVDEDPDDAARALGTDAMRVLELGRKFSSVFYAALDDDFNTSAALGHTFELARAINRLSNHKKAMKRGGPIVAPALEALGLLSGALGLLTLTTPEFQAEIKAKRLPLLGLTAPEVDALVTERTAARAARDWTRADEIRARLEAHRIAVMDRAEGSEWRVRLSSSEEPVSAS